MFCTGLAVAVLFVLVAWVVWSELRYTAGMDHVYGYRPEVPARPRYGPPPVGARVRGPAVMEPRGHVPWGERPRARTRPRGASRR